MSKVNIRPTNPLRVALLISNMVPDGPGILRGLFEYARPAKRWNFVPYPPPISAQSFRLVARGDFDSGVGLAGRDDLAAHVRRFRFPFVNLYGGDPYPGLPQVGTDDRQIGRMAAEHLLERGLTHFAFVGLSRGGFTIGRGEGFRRAIAAAGHRVIERIGFDPVYEPDGEHVRWLLDLPKPVGIFAVNDMVAAWVVNNCWFASIAVPDEAAIIGAEDDDLICQSSFPPLSSVRTSLRQVGYAAAELLDRMMQGRRPPKRPILFAPEGVHVRQSTDMLAVADPLVRRAVRFIQEHVVDPIGVRDLLRVVPMSRQHLNVRFRKARGRTAFAEIQHTKCEYAKSLLRQTDLRLDEIAARAGLSDARHVHLLVKRSTGVSPGQYRREARRPAGG